MLTPQWRWEIRQDKEHNTDVHAQCPSWTPHLHRRRRAEGSRPTFPALALALPHLGPVGHGRVGRAARTYEDFPL